MSEQNLENQNPMKAELEALKAAYNELFTKALKIQAERDTLVTTLRILASKGEHAPDCTPTE